jgi:hypothetical protein
MILWQWLYGMVVYIYIYIYAMYKWQEDSMSNSNGGFSVYATHALQPHRTSILPKNITQL